MLSSQCLVIAHDELPPAAGWVSAFFCIVLIRSCTTLVPPPTIKPVARRSQWPSSLRADGAEKGGVRPSTDEDPETRSDQPESRSVVPNLLLGVRLRVRRDIIRGDRLVETSLGHQLLLGVAVVQLLPDLCGSEPGADQFNSALDQRRSDEHECELADVGCWSAPAAAASASTLL